MAKTSINKYLTENQRQELIEAIIAYFLDEREEEIGIVAATEVLDFIELEIAPKIYAKAMIDSKELVKEQFAQLDLLLSERTLE